MVTLSVDAHKRTHTIVAVDANDRQLACKRSPPPRKITSRR